jgi:anti-anti-sigma factor
LDFDGVTQVDARGLGTLAELARQARASQRSLCLVNVSRRVRELLRLARLDEVLEIVYPIEEREVEHRAVA